MSAQKITPEMLEDLPMDVRQALAEAEGWIATRFKGRRVVPKPALVTLEIPELEETFYAVVVPPGGIAAQGIREALFRAAKAQTLEALQQAQEKALTECCYWVSGAPEDASKDPRVVAKSYLVELRQEVGSLGGAFTAVAVAVMEMLEQPEAKLGKL